jgi:hypothetical protein
MNGMEAIDAVGGAGSHNMVNANFESADSGSVFGISSEWIDSEGNLKPSEGHGTTGMGEGELINVNEVVEAAKAMGMSEQEISTWIEEFTSNEANFNPGQTDDQKKVGALLVLNEMVAAENINHLGLSEDQLRSLSGDAVQAAREGDAAQLRSILEGAGGNTGEMTDQQLLNVWSSNAHPRNHEILSGDAFQLTHLRMISAPDAADGTGGDPVGYMNDKGDWTQWDAIPAANSFLEQNKLFGSTVA